MPDVIVKSSSVVKSRNDFNYQRFWISCKKCRKLRPVRRNYRLVRSEPCKTGACVLIIDKLVLNFISLNFSIKIVFLFLIFHESADLNLSISIYNSPRFFCCRLKQFQRNQSLPPLSMNNYKFPEFFRSNYTSWNSFSKPLSAKIPDSHNLS